MTASDWVVIIGAIFLGVTQVLSMVLDYLRAKNVAAKVETVADKAALVADKVQLVAETATAVQEATAAAAADVKSTLQDHQQAADAQLKDVAAKLEEVHRATNGLTDRLVETTAAEALARGGAEERARALARNKAGAPPPGPDQGRGVP